MSSASSSTRWIDAIVVSMLTTTPFLRPREGCEPRPITFMAPSGESSATIATILDVPMSRPTMRFLLSFIDFGGCSCHGFQVFFAERGHTHRVTVAIAQVDGLDPGAGARERPDGLPVRGDEARKPCVGVLAAELERQRALAADHAHSPSAARRHAHFGDLERDRTQG